MKSAPLGNRSCPASVGVKARTATAKDGIRNALPEQCGAGDETDDEGEAEILRFNRVKSNRALSSASTADRERPEAWLYRSRPATGSGLFQPVPPAALAEHVGEAEERNGNQAKPIPVERPPPPRCGIGACAISQKPGSRQRQRNDAEEDPMSRTGIEQPALERRGDRRGATTDPSRTGPGGPAGGTAEKRER